MNYTDFARIVSGVEKVREAIRNEGPVPYYHRDVMARHQNEWPTLWSAINTLLYEFDQQYPEETPWPGQ